MEEDDATTIICFILICFSNKHITLSNYVYDVCKCLNYKRMKLKRSIFRHTVLESRNFTQNSNKKRNMDMLMIYTFGVQKRHAIWNKQPVSYLWRKFSLPLNIFN